MCKQIKLTTLFIFGAFITGCNSSYHEFNGKSGYKFETLNSDQFAVQYYGNAHSSMKDVETMWHHKARELCKGGAYHHKITTKRPLLKGNKIVMDGSLIPKPAAHYFVDGEISCIAPSLAIKLNQEKGNSLGEDFTSNQLISRSATN